MPAGPNPPSPSEAGQASLPRPDAVADRGGLQQRRAARVDCMGIAEIRTLREAYYVPCRTRNVSLHGLNVRLSREFELAQEVDVRVTLYPQGLPIACRGRIRWTTARVDLRDHPPFPFDIGIEFEEMPEASRERWRTFVEMLRQTAALTGVAGCSPVVIGDHLFVPFLQEYVGAPDPWELAIYERDRPFEQHRFSTFADALAYWSAFQRRMAGPTKPVEPV